MHVYKYASDSESECASGSQADTEHDTISMCLIAAENLLAGDRDSRPSPSRRRVERRRLPQRRSAAAAAPQRRTAVSVTSDGAFEST